jgi:hypothetical protein
MACYRDSFTFFYLTQYTFHFSQHSAVQVILHYDIKQMQPMESCGLTTDIYIYIYIYTYKSFIHLNPLL